MPCMGVDTLAGVIGGYNMCADTDGKESQTYRPSELEERDCGRHRVGYRRVQAVLLCCSSDGGVDVVYKR